ncbi:MAG: hypothetical protein ACYSUN_01080 [Planctomycetota bacterium]|jgi:hypothetical protein
MAKVGIVALEWDGLGLRGAVAGAERDGVVHFDRLVESRQADPAAALAEVIASLRAAGSFPQRCVLLTAEATAALVKLPLLAGKPRSPHEMAQLVRWELEPYFAQQSAARQLGAILVGRGHMGHDEVAQVTAAREERRESLSQREALSGPFGSVARDLGLIDDHQLREALAIESRFAQGDEHAAFACGWTPQRNGGPAEGEGSHWLVAAVPCARRDWWREALAGQGLRLQGIYPRIGIAAAALPTDEPGDRTVLESHWDLVVSTTVSNGSIRSLQVMPRGDEATAWAICGEMLDAVGAHGTVLCACKGDPQCSVLGGGATLLKPTVTGEAAAGTEGHVLARLAGGVRHALGRVPAAAAVRIPARDLGPPLRQRPGFWWSAAVAAALLLVLGGELLLAGSMESARQNLADVRDPLTRLERSVAAEKRRAAEVDQLQGVLAAAREQNATLAERLRRFEEELDERSGFLSSLLSALARSASDEVVLHAVEEENPGQVKVEGWALSEKAVQLFTRSVATRLAGQELRIAAQEVHSETDGRGDRPAGYTFAFRLAPPGPLLSPVGESRREPTAFEEAD